MKEKYIKTVAVLDCVCGEIHIIPTYFKKVGKTYIEHNGITKLVGQNIEPIGRWYECLVAETKYILE